MADIFKLLSRSTSFGRRTRKPADAPASPTTSTPATASEPAKKSINKKLKSKNSNAANGSATDSTAHTQPEVPDFFGLNEPAHKKRKRDAPDDDNSSSSPESSDSEHESGSDEEEQGAPTAEEDRLPTPEVTKRVLRQHKLKFTLLSPTVPAPAPNPPKKKKKKSKPEPPTPKKKEEVLITPLTSFSHLRSQKHGYALSPRLYSNILAQGYAAPTEVQMGTLPVLMNRNLQLPGIDARNGPVNLITCAPTGSGKTLAYVVPLLDGLLREQKEAGGKRKGVKAVILAPTKELVGQIVNEVKKLSLGTGMRVALLKKNQMPVSVVDEELAEQAGEEDDDEKIEQPEDGLESDASDSGSDEEPEDEDAKEMHQKKRPSTRIKADILVSTPLTLLHVIQSTSRPAMRGLTHLVLDEADVLLDPLFLEQTKSLWTHLLAYSPSLQSTLWSATISSSTESLVTSILSTPSSPSPSSSKSTPTILRLIVGIKNASLPTISQSLLYTASEAGKLHAIRQLLTTALKPPLLIFVQSIPRATALYSELLYDLPSPSRIAVLHSALPDSARAETMARLLRAEIWVLVTTDLMARGMDFRGVRQVVNYDIPTSVASYIHRVGRTGRQGQEGERGEAVTYYTTADVPYIRLFAHVMKASGGDVPEWLLSALPRTGRREKRRLKQHGVLARGAGAKGKEARITTKPAWQRRAEEKVRGRKEHTSRLKKAGVLERKKGGREVEEADADGEGDEWGGFDE